MCPNNEVNCLILSTFHQNLLFKHKLWENTLQTKYHFVQCAPPFFARFRIKKFFFHTHVRRFQNQVPQSISQKNKLVNLKMDKNVYKFIRKQHIKSAYRSSFYFSSPHQRPNRMSKMKVCEEITTSLTFFWQEVRV